MKYTYFLVIFLSVRFLYVYLFVFLYVRLSLFVYYFAPMDSVSVL